MSQFTQNSTVVLFTQKNGPKLSEIWAWDPRYGIRRNLFRIPDPRVEKSLDPGSAKLEAEALEPLLKAFVFQGQSCITPPQKGVTCMTIHHVSLGVMVNIGDFTPPPPHTPKLTTIFA